MTKDELFTWGEKLLQPSSIKGFVLIIGTVLAYFLKPEQVDNISIDIAAIAGAVYGLIQIFRNESKQITNVVEKAKSAGVLSVFLVMVLFTPLAQADPFYCFDPIDGIGPDSGTYEITVDGGDSLFFTGAQIIVATDQATDDTHCVYDVGALGAGGHTFRYRGVDVSGWEGEWSDPFVASRPGMGSGQKIFNPGL